MCILSLLTDWRYIITVYSLLVSGAVGELGSHCRWKKGGTSFDKESKLKGSEVQWSGELDSTFHWVPIRGSFQRVGAASQGLLQLSSQKGINIPPGLSGCCQYPRGDFRRVHLKGATAALWRRFSILSTELRNKLHSCRRQRRMQVDEYCAHESSDYLSEEC